MLWILCASGQKSQTQCMWDIRRALTLIVRDELLAQRQFLTSRHTQEIRFQYNVSKTFLESAQLANHAIIKYETRTMRYSTVMRDQRCLCREFIVFSSGCFSDKTPSLTQINSIYKTLLVTWLLWRQGQPTSCPSVNTGDIIRMTVVSEQRSAHPNHIRSRCRRQLQNASRC
jgi:hypothetical protein